MRTMSIKLSKASSHGSRRRDEDETSFGGPKAAAEPEKSWPELVQDRPEDTFVPYALTGRFQKGAALAHATFGRGVVVSVDGRRIDVVFEGGKKTLSHAG